MVKLSIRSPAVIAVVSFLLIWYAVMHQRINSTEHMTGAARLKEEDKKNVTDYMVLSVTNPADAKKIKLSPEAQTFINFLDQNPITAIDDKFMQNLTEIVKRMSANDFILKRLLENPDTLKDGVRTVSHIITAQIIWAYADPYEKLKEAPTQSEFREQITHILLEHPQFKPVLDGLRKTADIGEKAKARISQLESELLTTQDAKQKVNLQRQLDEQKNALDIASVQSYALGTNTYPLGSSTSPMVNQMFDIVYKYYFGETVSTSNLASGAWKAIVGVFGSLGAMAVVAGIVYFFFLR